MTASIPISTLFIGIQGLLAFILSYIVVTERVSTRVWHGESKADVAIQPNYLENPNQWANFVEGYTQKTVTTKDDDDGLLQRKVRAYGNFAEYVPLALLFIIALELMGCSAWLLWLLGGALTVARIFHAWGLISTYGPSIYRATGFFLTWFVYLVGAIACIYYAMIDLI